jgi:hypothetical protein
MRLSVFIDQGGPTAAITTTPTTTTTTSRSTNATSPTTPELRARGKRVRRRLQRIIPPSPRPVRPRPQVRILSSESE